MSDATRDLLSEIDATLKLGRERHLDFRERSFDLLKRLRPMVEREGLHIEIHFMDSDRSSGQEYYYLTLAVGPFQFVCPEHWKSWDDADFARRKALEA